MPALAGWRGLISTLCSSGTIPEGTISSGDRNDVNQVVPKSMLTLPGGAAPQPMARPCEIDRLGLRPDCIGNLNADQIAVQGKAAGAQVHDGFEAGQSLDGGGVDHRRVPRVPTPARHLRPLARQIVGFIGGRIAGDAPALDTREGVGDEALALHRVQEVCRSRPPKGGQGFVQSPGLNNPEYVGRIQVARRP
jgi:hypothetical protein